MTRPGRPPPVPASAAAVRWLPAGFEIEVTPNTSTASSAIAPVFASTIATYPSACISASIGPLLPRPLPDGSTFRSHTTNRRPSVLPNRSTLPTPTFACASCGGNWKSRYRAQPHPDGATERPEGRRSWGSEAMPCGPGLSCDAPSLGPCWLPPLSRAPSHGSNSPKVWKLTVFPVSGGQRPQVTAGHVVFQRNAPSGGRLLLDSHMPGAWPNGCRRPPRHLRIPRDDTLGQLQLATGLLGLQPTPARDIERSLCRHRSRRFASTKGDENTFPSQIVRIPDRCSCRLMCQCDSSRKEMR